MKRFWTEARHEQGEDGWALLLDGRPLRTPGRLALVVPHERLAAAVASEWNDVKERIDPRAMPLTGLANAAVERAAADRRGFAAGLAKYAEGDLLCYRSEEPPGLVERQAAAWDPLLVWARRRFDIGFAITSGILHVPQPPAAVQRLGQAVDSLDNFRLAGLSPLVTIGGSLVTALALLEGAIGAADGWAAVSVDERWQIETWGEDAEAVAAMESRHRDWLAAARFLDLLQP